MNIHNYIVHHYLKHPNSHSQAYFGRMKQAIVIFLHDDVFYSKEYSVKNLSPSVFPFSQNLRFLKP